MATYIIIIMIDCVLVSVIKYAYLPQGMGSLSKLFTEKLHTVQQVKYARCEISFFYLRM